MSTMTVIAQVKPGKRREFLYPLTSLYSNREEEEGLKKFTLYLITEWETQKDLERHLHTEKFGVLNGALEVCAQSQKSGTAILLKRGPKFPNPNLNPGKITRVNAS